MVGVYFLKLSDIHVITEQVYSSNRHVYDDDLLG